MSYTISTGWKHVPKNPRTLKTYFSSTDIEGQETRKNLFNAMKKVFDVDGLSASKSYRLVASQITDLKTGIKIGGKTIFSLNIPSENRVYDWIKDEKDIFNYFKTNKPGSKKVVKQIEL